jgi:hypothetical protein
MNLDEKLAELEKVLEDIRDHLPLSGRFRQEYIRQVTVQMSATMLRTTEPYPNQELEVNFTNSDQDLSKE